MFSTHPCVLQSCCALSASATVEKSNSGRQAARAMAFRAIVVLLQSKECPSVK